MTKKCDCMAQAHGLVNNCTGCGKIVCEYEGEGPCSFCGNPVLKPENIDQHAETERMMREWEADSSLSQTYFVAIEHKTRLINQDRDRSTTKNLIDEDADWYELKGDVWQKDDVRRQAVQMMIKQEEEDKYAKENVISSFNFNKGTVDERKITYDRTKDKELIAAMMAEDRQGAEIEHHMMQQDIDRRLKDKDREILESVKEVYKDKLEKLDTQKPRNDFNLHKKVENDDCYQEFLKAVQHIQRQEHTADKEEVYDKAFYRLGPDDNKCLSMYQPWASLLIYGFKRFEGRHWDTNYRGPLWIHAGAKEADQDTIKAVEDQYRKLYQGVEMPEFPKTYPTGCIIGVVDLQNVIDQKLYTECVPKKYTGESTSEHLFVIRNPRKLMVNIKCSGSKGIYDLSGAIVSTAISTVQRIPSNWFPYFADNLPSNRELIQGKIEEGGSAGISSHSHMQKPQKSSSVNETFSATQVLKLGPAIEPMIEEFIKLYEKANFKKIEKGQDGQFDNSIDQFLPGVDHLKSALLQLITEAYDADSHIASISLPKKVDFYSVTKLTRKFDLRKSMHYMMFIVMGKKSEFAFDGRSGMIAGGSAIMPQSITANVGQIVFMKVPKTASQTGLSMIGECSILAFH
jgi:activating signal cointegrator 1